MIETERLLMRPFEPGDIDIIGSLYGDPVIMKYMPCGCLTQKETEDHLASIIEEWHKTPQERFEMAVVRKGDGKKIGRAHFRLDSDGDNAMIGWLIDESEWNKGYATEVTKGLLEYCFNEIDVHRVYALCHPDNTASWKLLENCGFRREAHYVKKAKYKRDGGSRWEDELEYAILKEEYFDSEQ